MVLRFDPQLEDWDSYHSMLTYLVGKRRCGVISTNYHGIKDMYLVPLPAGRDVPYQLLPLRGPGALMLLPCLGTGGCLFVCLFVCEICCCCCCLLCAHECASLIALGFVLCERCFVCSYMYWYIHVCNKSA